MKRVFTLEKKNDKKISCSITGLSINDARDIGMNMGIFAGKLFSEKENKTVDIIERTEFFNAFAVSYVTTMLVTMPDDLRTKTLELFNKAVEKENNTEENNTEEASAE